MTEHGPIACRAVVLAGGAWSALLLRHLGFELPQLKVKASVQRTAMAPLITESAVGARRAAFGRRQDGGYTIARSGTVTFDLTPAALRHFRAFLPALKEKWGEIKLRAGRAFVDELTTSASWKADKPTPFERTRVLDPAPDHGLLDQVMKDAADLFPQLQDARPIERWAGMIDVTPDEIPVLGPIDSDARPVRRHGLFRPWLRHRPRGRLPHGPARRGRAADRRSAAVPLRPLRRGRRHPQPGDLSAASACHTPFGTAPHSRGLTSALADAYERKDLQTPSS